MYEGETIKQPQERIEQLERENELLRSKIIELEACLTQYENAHTPPSLRRGSNRKKDPEKKNNRHWIMKVYSIKRFTFIVNLSAEPTDNRAERALRPPCCFEKDPGHTAQ
jgi:predicted RNase H-like nuclease (RuvC/YqgF family)